jgi:competence protein ComEC
VSRGFNAQDLTIILDKPYQGKIRAVVARYPEWEYGDRVAIEGAVKAPSDLQKNFLAKDNIFGVVSFPDIELMTKNQGSKIKYQLLKLKYFAESSFARSFSPEEAAFMSGLTLGETAEFSKEFKERMKTTGTTHLVALSGYNITIIAAAVMAMLGTLRIGRKWRFIGSTVAILAFVLMTGAEASVVRAAIMGFIGLLAGQVARAYSFRNAITVAAFAMVLTNPKVLVWDIGFELSFLALLGLVYVRPALMNFFRVTGGAGFLEWRENLFTTLAAQIAVLPLLLSRFGTFSVLSILTNVLILAFVPLTMSVGFLVVGISLISQFMARLIGFVGSILMRYEMWVIDFFSRFDRASISFDHMSVWLSLIYYICLILFVVWVSKTKEKNATIAFT